MKTWPGQTRARSAAAEHLQQARECVAHARAKNDPVYLEIARVHVKTARHFHRNAWRGPRWQER